MTENVVLTEQRFAGGDVPSMCDPADCFNQTMLTGLESSR